MRNLSFFGSCTLTLGTYISVCKLYACQLVVLTGADVYLTFPRQEIVLQILPAFVLDLGILNWGMTVAVEGERVKFAWHHSFLEKHKNIYIQYIGRTVTDAEIFNHGVLDPFRALILDLLQ